MTSLGASVAVGVAWIAVGGNEVEVGTTVSVGAMTAVGCAGAPHALTLINSTTKVKILQFFFMRFPFHTSYW
jgi:ABC-type spermidine/putrescine transport system permease subunit I